MSSPQIHLLTAAEAKHCACGSGQFSADSSAAMPPACATGCRAPGADDTTFARAPTAQRCNTGSLLFLAQYTTPTDGSGRRSD